MYDITCIFRYIKDYDGGILMECKIDPKLPYTDLSIMVRRQRQVDESWLSQAFCCQCSYLSLTKLTAN